MFEPLLRINLDDSLASRLSTTGADVQHADKKLIIISEIFEIHDRSSGIAAELNTAAIVEALLHSDEVGLIACGDDSTDATFNPLLTTAQRIEANREAWQHLKEGENRAAQFVGAALLRPGLRLCGVASSAAEQAQRARSQRVMALRDFHIAQLPEMAPGLPQALFEQFRRFASSSWGAQHAAWVDWSEFSEEFSALARELALPTIENVEGFAGVVEADVDDVVRSCLTGIQLEANLARVPPARLARLVATLLRAFDSKVLLEVVDRVPLRPIQRMGQAIRDIERAHVPPDALEVLDAISSGPRPNAMVRLARRSGVDLAYYPALRGLERILAAEYPGINADWAILQEEVFSTLNLNERGEARLPRLVEIALREEAPGVRTAWRPLQYCANKALAEVTEEVARDLEGNKVGHPGTRAKLLDLAAALGIDSERFNPLRRYHASVESSLSTDRLLRELNDLEEEITWTLGRRIHALPRFVALRKDLASLRGLSGETLPLTAAEPLLASPPSFRSVAERLQAFGRVEWKELWEKYQSIEGCVAPGLGFYDSCRLELAGFAETVNARMEESRAGAGIMLCGGFYSDALARRLAGRSYRCSVINPRFHLPFEEPARGSVSKNPQRDPTFLRKESESLRFQSNISFHVMGGGLSSKLAELAGGEADKEPLLGSSDGGRRSDAGQWVRDKSIAAWFEQMIEFGEGVFHRCRVCKRLAPLGGGRLITRGERAPLVVLSCERCDPLLGKYLCTNCAPRQRVALLPGHVPDPEDEGHFMMVCNLHGEPLGTADGNQQLVQVH